MPESARTALNQEERERLTEEIAQLLEHEPPQAATRKLSQYHPADQAEIIEGLDQADQDRLLQEFSSASLAELIEYFDEEPRTRFVSTLKGERLAEVLVHVDDELAADIVEEMPDARVEEVLGLLAGRDTVAELLSYPEESVGRWMSTEVVALKLGWTVEEAFAYLRQQSPDADQPFYLYVVDDDGKLKGVISLRRFIVSDPQTPLEDIMTSDVIQITADMDQEKAAELLRHYDLLALPVVDEEGRLIGYLTADDVLDVQVEEATEDIYLQAGLDADASPLSSVGTTLKQRAPWLLVNLTIGFLSALIVNSFSDTIERVAALAAFMPIIAGHGGNTGSQTTTLVVRGIALGQIYNRDIPKIIMKELCFGLTYGTIAGLLAGSLAYLLTANGWLAGVVFLAMTGNIIVAGMAGTMIPLGMKALNIDPALASTVWLTTFTDWVGFLLLLGLGTMFLHHLQGVG